MDPVALTTLLRDGGPWGLLALALGGLVWMTTKAFSQQSTIEKHLKEQNAQLVDLLKASTEASVQQTASNGALGEKLKELGDESRGRGAQIQTLQEDMRRVLREAKLGD